jgi:phytoene dehydrogenase-like protein
MNEKVIIVGGGLAGLTAANFLAKAGRQVVLFEKSHAVGGRAATTQKNGIHFNLGPHALYQGGPALDILRELGVEFRGRSPKVAGSLAVKNGRKHTLPGSLMTMLTTSLFGVSAKFETLRLLANFGKIDARKVDHLTVREWLDRELRSAEARQLVQALFRVSTYTNDPERQSAGAAVEQTQSALAKGVLYLDGGWQTLVEGLRAKALEAGAQIVAESRVAKILRDRQSGRVTGVRLADGTLRPSSAVIVAAGPDEVCDLVEGGNATAVGQWAEDAVPVRAACLDIALSSLPRPTSNFALGIDRPLYFSVHSATARLAPNGTAVIHAAMYLGPEHVDPKAVQHELEELLDLVQPGWQKLTLERRFLPAMTVTHAVVSARQGGLAGRPGPEVPGVEGLYVAGDWVGAEGQLADASVASGKRAAELVNRVSGRIAAAA